MYQQHAWKTYAKRKKVLCILHITLMTVSPSVLLVGNWKEVTYSNLIDMWNLVWVDG